MSSVREGRSAPEEVTALVTAWIEGQRAASVSFDKIAKQLGVTKTTVINIHGGSRGVGSVLESNFAALLYGGSVDALRRAARDAWEERARQGPSLPPSLAAAIEALRATSPVHEDDIKTARVIAQHGADLSMPTWVVVLTDLARARGRSPAKLS